MESVKTRLMRQYQFIKSITKRPLFDGDRDQEWRGVAVRGQKVDAFDLHSQGIAFSLYGVLD